MSRRKSTRDYYKKQVHELTDSEIDHFLHADTSSDDSDMESKRIKLEPGEGSNTVGGHAGKEVSGGGGGGGGGGDPIPMAMPQHQRAVDKFTIKAAGTTFVGPGISTTGTNDWYRFPWEITKPFVNDWTSLEIAQKWMYYKVKHVHITFKNPLCIQEIGSTTSALATAGQNLHANLYGYADSMYIRGTQNPFANVSAANINDLIKSWRHHGYNGGVAWKLPLLELADTPAMFQNNFPDVKQCGMGPGKSMSFGWNVNNKYWRPTDNFLNTNNNESGVPLTSGFTRWDERLGCVTSIFIPVAGSAGQQIAFRANILTGSPSATAVDRSEWFLQNMSIGPSVPIGTGGTVSGFNIMHVDEDPMPGLYLQLQPQLGAISAGISDSICQLQFEITAELECTGRLPRMALDSTTGTSASLESKFNGRNTTCNKSIPLFYDMSPDMLDAQPNL